MRGRYPVDATAGSEWGATADLLERTSFLDAAERAIQGLGTPATVGLFGEWGSGKTTLLRLLEKRFTERRVVVRFDPWHYDGEPSPLPALVAALRVRLATLDPQAFDKTHWDALADLALAATPSLVKAFVVGGGLSTGGIAAPLAGAAAKVVEALKGWFTKRRRAAPAALEQKPAVDVLRLGLATAVTTLAEAASAKEPSCSDGALVLVDDLDRCLPDAMLVLLNALRVLFRCQDDLPITFVCAVDRRQVVSVLRAHYAPMDSVEAERYLEKIFDVSLWIPEIAGDSGLERMLGYLRVLLDLPCDGGPPRTETAQQVLALFGGGKGFDDLVGRCLRYNLFANPRLLHRLAVRIAMTAETWHSLSGSERSRWEACGVFRPPSFTAIGLALLAISVYDPGFRPNVLHRPQLWEPLAALIAKGPIAQLEHPASELTRTARDLGLLEVLERLVGVSLDNQASPPQLRGLDPLRKASDTLRHLGL